MGGTISLIYGCALGLLGCVAQEAGSHLRQAIKLSYGVLLFWFCIALFILLFHGKTFLSFLNMFIGCPDDSQLQSCLGISSVFRISFVFTVFHIIILFCCLTRDAFSKFVNEGFWMLKACLIGISFLATLFISNSYFILYSQ